MKNKVLFFMLAVILLCAFPLTAYANSVEPPSMIILVTNAPDDLTVDLEIPSNTGEVRIQSSSKMWEKYFRIYYYPDDDDIANNRVLLSVKSSVKSFTCPLPDGLQNGYRYNNLLYLDFENETLSVGEPAYREPLLVSLRVVLTLISEGIVFFLIGFRCKSSWIIFTIINLLTQGWLNLSISGADLSGSTAYMLLWFILMEFVIFIVESIAITAFVREHKWYRRLGTALLANIVSLILGIFIIGNLPI